jgi:hypothetical protein
MIHLFFALPHALPGLFIMRIGPSSNSFWARSQVDKEGRQSTGIACPLKEIFYQKEPAYSMGGRGYEQGKRI